VTAPYYLRPARADEIETLRDIEKTAATRLLGTDLAWVAGDEPTDAAALAERIADGRCLVATQGDRPVGFVIFEIVDDTAHVEELDVLPDHAGHRLGARLIDAVAAWADQRGLPALTLSTFRDVPWNAPYYRRLGFTDIPMAELTPGLAEIRTHHRAKGLVDDLRVFMRRTVALSSTTL
jgi:GNAT superfamily N-acetyltransferase